MNPEIMENAKQIFVKSFLIIGFTTILLLNTIAAHSQVQNEIFENIYIHMDKSIYIPGEDVWFKAYILNDKSCTPTNISHILYLNIADSQGKCIYSTKLFIENGFANGEYHIPDTIKKGSFQIVAYTENMKNLPTSFWFQSKFVIDPSPNDLWEIICQPDLLKIKESILTGDVYCLYDGNYPIQNMKIQCRIESSGEKIELKTEKTNSLGKFEFKWDIPTTLRNKDVILCLDGNYFNDKKELRINIPLGNKGFHINFYPEGGSLVQGLINMVAFEALDNYGSPLKIYGTLLDQNGNKLQEVKTNHEGMGIFKFIPETNKTYYFKIEDPILGDSLYNLPSVLESGYVLSQEQTVKSIVSLRISMTPDMIGKKVKLSLSDGFKQTNIFESELNKEKLFSFITSSYPVGIYTLTLFSEDNKPVAERLVFLNKYKKLQLSIETDKDFYNPREKVEIKIKALDFEGNPSSANLSLSVTEENRITNDYSDISSYILLESKLKGTVRNPSYYMQDTPESDSALNILLMTHGWRKISIIDEYSKLILSPNNISGIKGHVYTKKKKPVKNATIQIINTRKWQAVSSETDEQGSFFIPIEDYLLVADDHDLSIGATIPNKKTRSLIIILDPEMDLDKIANLKINEENVSVYEMAEKNALQIEEGKKMEYTDFDNSTESIDEVIVVGKKLAPADKEAEVRERMYKINKKESAEIKTVNIQSSNENFDGGMLQLLRTISPGFQVSGLGKIIYRGYKSLLPENEEGVLFVVDGIAKGDNVDAISWITISNIKEIKVITNPGSVLRYASGYSGVVEITLKNAEDVLTNVKNDSNKNSLSEIKGFKIAREFYSPDYFAKVPDQPDDIDFRSTLYWNPNIVLDNKGQGKIAFYNGDKRTKFRCQIEGVSQSGLLGNTQIKYMVK